jgi:hypothetical protein
MAKILVAASQEPQAICNRMLNKHELFFAETVSQAHRFLEDERLDLIICTVVFDESRMFDLLRLAKANGEWKRIPFLCCKVRPKLLDYPLALEGVQIACRTLGAAAFLDIETYKIDPENEMVKDIERFLQK